jgi:hypothetical protein
MLYDRGAQSNPGPSRRSRGLRVVGRRAGVQFLCEAILLGLLGGVAGLIPARRAARLSPTQALWSV